MNATMSDAVLDLVLVCDESGAKGYADVREGFTGEVGIFAGFICPQERLEAVRQALDQACQPFRTAEGKLHITDLEPHAAEQLRVAVLGVLSEHQLPCVYEAIHVAGFGDNYRSSIQRSRGLQASRRSRIRVNIREVVPGLHPHLLSGLFAKTVAFKEENPDYLARRLVVLTDRVDPGVATQMRAELDEFRSDGEHRTTQGGWDPETRRRLQGEIRSTIRWPEGWETPTGLSMDYVLNSDDSNGPLTVAADVLANSLNWWFTRRRQGPEVGAELHRRSAVVGHPLAHLFYGIPDDRNAPWSSDVLYPHPLQLDREEVARLIAGDALDANGYARVQETVHLRAFALYEMRDGQDGDHLSDWHQARRELGLPEHMHV